MVIERAEFIRMGADTHTFSDGGCNLRQQQNKHCTQDMPGMSKRKTHIKSKLFKSNFNDILK